MSWISEVEVFFTKNSPFFFLFLAFIYSFLTVCWLCLYCWLGFNATGSSASNQSYTNYSEGSSSKSSTFNSNSGSIQKYNKPYTRDYQSGSRDNSRYSNKRSVTGSNSHPVSYNKTLTGGDSSSEYKNSSSSSSNRDNAGNNSGSFSTFGSPSKVGYVPSDKSGAYSSEVGGSSRITSGSSSSGSYQSQSSGGGGGSSSGSGYQRASSGAGDRSVGIQGSGGSSSSQYIPRGPLHYCDVCKISCAGPQTYKVSIMILLKVRKAQK